MYHPKRSALRQIWKLALVTAGAHIAFGQSPAASQGDASQATAKLVCGPHASDPRRLRAFQALVTFQISQGRLEGYRQLTSGGGGREDFSGTISPQGLVLVQGTGSYASGSSWTYEFTGVRNRLSETVLNGYQENALGAVGSRQCKLRFLRSWPAI
jgi:hypothetical protein